MLLVRQLGAHSRARLWCYGWPVAAVPLLALADPQRRPASLAIYFTLVLLWPISLVTMRLAGVRAGAAVGGACVALFAGSLVLPRPNYLLQPVVLERPLTEPTQAVRYTMQIPTNASSWRMMWGRQPEPEAYLYIQASRPLSAPVVAIRLTLPGRAATLTNESVVPGVSEEGIRARYWYRLRLSRAELEQSDRFPVVLSAAASGRPEGDPNNPAVALLGAFSFRPTYAGATSEFFDGSRWSADPGSVLPGFPEGQGQARYSVEIRIVEPTTRRLLAVYY